LRKTLKNRQIMGYVPKLSHFLLAIQPSSGVLAPAVGLALVASKLIPPVLLST
jgi:hypothetical protein